MSGPAIAPASSTVARVEAVVPSGRPYGSGDGWVELPDGRRFWGRAGAAGLLAISPAGTVLLQHRVAWSHFGGTWGLPGGARHEGESVLDGAYREAHEESALEVGRLAPRFTSMLDLQVWSYTTVAADAPAELPVHVADAESTAFEWVAADRVADRPLHPGLAAAWPAHLARLAARPALVVDAANVVGSRPDGWWRDRRGATERLLRSLAELRRTGVQGEADLDGPGDPVGTWWPQVVAVVEGDARGASAPPEVQVLETGYGDDALVAEVAGVTDAGRAAWAVTADAALGERVRAVGGLVRGPRWLLDRLP